jgi:cysteine desulfurase
MSNDPQPRPPESGLQSDSSAPIYLDHGATTAVDPAVLKAMLPWFSEHFGNAASKSHPYGWRAEEAVAKARKAVAALLGAQAKEIVFTSGATEANNLAILGLAEKAGFAGHAITVKSEHKAVIDPFRHLEQRGVAVTWLEPGADGLITVEQVQDAFREDTFLVSVMAANNEIGVLQPVAAIGALCRAHHVRLHTDATQAMATEDVDVERDAIDLLSLSAHKLYGPKGVGALYVRRKPRVQLAAQQLGGGHERGLRSGTLNVPGIVGLGEAARLSLELRDADRARLRALRDRLLEGLRARLDHLVVHGSLEHRLPGNLSVGFAGVEAEQLLLKVNKVVALSTGSACTSATLEPSHVLRAIGVAHDLAHSTVRFGLGRHTSAAEIDRVVDAIADAVDALRAASPLSA